MSIYDPINDNSDPYAETNRGPRRHKLLTAAIRKALPREPGADLLAATVHTKFFSPVSRYTFYVLAAQDDGHMFGFCISPLGPDCDEFGPVMFAELERCRVGVPVAMNGFTGTVPVVAIERDCYFEPRPLREVLRREHPQCWVLA